MLSAAQHLPLPQLEAERARRAAEDRKRRQEVMRHEMVAANQLQLQLKVGGGAWCSSMAWHVCGAGSVLHLARTPGQPGNGPGCMLAWGHIQPCGPVTSLFHYRQAERRAVEKAREDDFRRRMLERLQDEDRLEQMNAQVGWVHGFGRSDAVGWLHGAWSK